MIYLDNNATTRMAPEVLEAMLPFFREHFGNASSAHALGRMPEGALVHARGQVAALLGCQPAEIVFNSGGTEGINHVFKGVFETFPAKRHVVTTAVEHSAVLAMVDWLKLHGIEVTLIGVDSDGRLDMEGLEKAIRPDTALVSVMAANNETGVIFPIQAVTSLAKARGALVHVDAVQAAGKVPLCCTDVDFMNISSHKFHGPKGAGALYIRRGVRLKPFVAGGHQERSRRGGTENVPALVGMGRAAESATAHLTEMDSLARMRDRLEQALATAVLEMKVNGGNAPRLPGTSLLSFKGVEGEALLLKLNERGICVSTGSACTTGQKEPSHVLRAMGVPAEWARGTIRISMSRETTEEDVAHVLEVLPSVVVELRQLGPLGR